MTPLSTQADREWTAQAVEDAREIVVCLRLAGTNDPVYLAQFWRELLALANQGIALAQRVEAEEADMRERYDRQVSTPVPGGGW